MRKIKTLFLYVLTTVQLIAPNSSFSQENDLNSSDLTQNLRSKKIFQKYMNNPIASEEYRRQLWQLINIEPERYLLDLFYNSNNPIIQDLRKPILEEHLRQVQYSSIQSKLTMLSVVSGLSDYYDNLLNTIKDCAKESGLSQENIDAIEFFFVAGDYNAFTVSGSKEKLLVYIQSDLAKNLSQSEIRSVVSHEIGHVISRHSLSVKYSGVLFFLIANQVYPESFQSAEHQENAFVSQLAKRIQLKYSPNEIKALTNEFIVYLINLLQNTNSPSQTIQFFSELLANYSTISFSSPNINLYWNHVFVANNAMSRMREKSADRYSMAFNTNINVASSILKLMTNMNHTPREKKRIIDHITKTVRDTIAVTNTNLLQSIDSASHPAIGTRMVDIQDESTYPAIIFANPFMRLVLLESSLEHANYSEEFYIKQSESPQLNLSFTNQETPQKISEQLINDTIALVNEIGLGAEVNPRFNNIIQYFIYEKINFITYYNASIKFSEELPREQSIIMKNSLKMLEQRITQKPKLLLSLEAELYKTLKSNALTESEISSTLAHQQLLADLYKAGSIEELTRVFNDISNPSRFIKSKTFSHNAQPENISFNACERLLVKYAYPSKDELK
jgi:Zn-dependent protease with chaperone function